MLSARGIAAGYEGRTVVRDCSLDVPGGELVAIVGPNGAGKSTLLRVLAGLIRPTAGAVTLHGTELSVLSRAEIARRVAVVPQIFDTIFPFTVREVVALGRTARLGLFGISSGADIAAIERAMRELELDGLASRRIDRLSGGERQRAVLAMALAQEADVLLLDEPTVHLDPAHQIATLAHVERLARSRGLAVVAVLHDLNLASAVAARVAVMVDGRIVRAGTFDATIDRELLRSVFGERLTLARHDGRVYVLPTP
jgi:iron complex transport system ATP-binding protein